MNQKEEEKEFVTRKITNAVARIKLGLQDCVELGNLDAKETGVTQRIMLGLCGYFYSRMSQMIM